MSTPNINSLLSALFGLSGDTKSYGLKKITDILDSEEIKYRIVRSRFDQLYSTACRVSFEGSDIVVSVQTSPNVAGDAFCETSILNEHGLLNIPSIGYTDCVRHTEPLNFLVHIRGLKDLVTNHHSNTFSDGLLHKQDGSKVSTSTLSSTTTSGLSSTTTTTSGLSSTTTTTTKSVTPTSSFSATPLPTPSSTESTDEDSDDNEDQDEKFPPLQQLDLLSLLMLSSMLGGKCPHRNQSSESTPSATETPVATPASDSTSNNETTSTSSSASESSTDTPNSLAATNELLSLLSSMLGGQTGVSSSSCPCPIHNQSTETPTTTPSESSTQNTETPTTTPSESTETPTTTPSESTETPNSANSLISLLLMSSLFNKAGLSGLSR